MAIKARLQLDGEDVAGDVKELQRYAEAGCTVAFAAGAANVCTVTVQATDGLGNALAGVQNIDFYISTSATGANITAAAFTGTLVPTTGALLATISAKQVFSLITDATGKFVGSLTDTAKTAGQYFVAIRARGDVVVAGPTITASYG